MLGAFFVPLFYLGQVGINTPNPQATLDVTGNPTITTSLDGIIAPRLTGDQLRAKTYTTAQTGAIIYATAPDSAPAGQTINVTSSGYYYFDGTVWKNIAFISLNGTGTVIAINGQPQVAQEIVVRPAGFTLQQVPVASAVNPGPFKNLTSSNEVIDNENTFTGTSTNNTFTVSATGVYQITMNINLQASGGTVNGNCYFGLRNITDNTWTSLRLDTLTNLANGQLEVINLIDTLTLNTGKTYSFWIGQQSDSGSVNMTGGYLSIKRVK